MKKRKHGILCILPIYFCCYPLPPLLSFYLYLSIDLFPLPLCNETKGLPLDMIYNFIKKIFETDTHTHSKNMQWELFPWRDLVAQLIDVWREGATTSLFPSGSPFFPRNFMQPVCRVGATTTVFLIFRYHTRMSATPVHHLDLRDWASHKRIKTAGKTSARSV